MFALLLKTFEYLAPLSTLTYMSGKLTDAKLGKLTQALIKKFIKAYKIDLDECLEPDLAKYETFNDFFVRRLKPEARPLDQKCIAASPVDGTVGQAGDIKAGRLIQAKGIDYSLRGLLGGIPQDVDCFSQGRFCCIYLSPANYHRIHMPLDGTLVRTIHIPGRHFPVGRRNVSNMPDLFTKNERLVCFFNTASGPFALVMVGAAMVGSIVTTWDGRIVRRKDLEIKNFTPDQYQFKKGDELGMFKFGSTVICVWPEQLGALNELMVSGQVVKMGQAMIGEGEVRETPAQPTPEAIPEVVTDQSTQSAQGNAEQPTQSTEEQTAQATQNNIAPTQNTEEKGSQATLSTQDSEKQDAQTTQSAQTSDVEHDNAADTNSNESAVSTAHDAKDDSAHSVESDATFTSKSNDRESK